MKYSTVKPFGILRTKFGIGNNMLHINFETNRIDESPLIGDNNTIVITGAPGLLTKKIKETAKAAGVKYTRTHNCACQSRKIPLGGSTCSTPKVKLKTHADYMESMRNAIIKHYTIEEKSSNVKAKIDKNLDALRNDLATSFVTNTAFVSDLRDALEASTNFNPARHTITTRNVQIALALYSYYDLSTSFSSTEGATKIRKQVAATKEGVSRLGTELSILTARGQSTATRYFFPKSFETTLIKTLHNGKHDSLVAVVDTIQDDIDSV